MSLNSWPYNCKLMSGYLPGSKVGFSKSPKIAGVRLCRYSELQLGARTKTFVVDGKKAANAHVRSQLHSYQGESNRAVVQYSLLLFCQTKVFKKRFFLSPLLFLASVCPHCYLLVSLLTTCPISRANEQVTFATTGWVRLKHPAFIIDVQSSQSFGRKWFRALCFQLNVQKICTRKLTNAEKLV